jgi:hypothetical protein
MAGLGGVLYRALFACTFPAASVALDAELLRIGIVVLLLKLPAQLSAK